MLAALSTAPIGLTMTAPTAMLTALSTAPLGLTMTADAQFARGNDFLGTGAKVSARQVANAIGRWQSHDEWNSIGAAGKLDAFTTSPAPERAQ